jgi:hypothetical protein
LQEQLTRVNASANGKLFESQVLAGCHHLHKSYACLDSKKTVAYLKMRHGQKIFTDEQLANLHKVSALLCPSEGSLKSAKLELIAEKKAFKVENMEFDGFFTRRAIARDDEAAHNALWGFLGRTSTNFSRLDDSENCLPDVCHPPPFKAEAQPTHVIFEVCITAEEAQYKIFQLAKDICVAQNIADHTHPVPLPILYVNGNILSAREAVRSLRTILHGYKSSSPALDNLVATLKQTYVLYTPYRNVYDVLNDLTENMKALEGKVDGLKNEMASMKTELMAAILSIARARPEEDG